MSGHDKEPAQSWAPAAGKKDKRVAAAKPPPVSATTDAFKAEVEAARKRNPQAQSVKPAPERRMWVCPRSGYTRPLTAADLAGEVSRLEARSRDSRLSNTARKNAAAELGTAKHEYLVFRGLATPDAPAPAPEPTTAEQISSLVAEKQSLIQTSNNGQNPIAEREWAAGQLAYVNAEILMVMENYSKGFRTPNANIHRLRTKYYRKGGCTATIGSREPLLTPTVPTGRGAHEGFAERFATLLAEKPVQMDGDMASLVQQFMKTL